MSLGHEIDQTQHPERTSGYSKVGTFNWVRYVHGQGTDQPLAMEVYPLGANPVPGTGSVYYFHADGEGSIRTLTDANAQVANSYDYDSFGRRLSAVEAVSQPYGWKAREFIPGPDIYYNRARFYDPVLGRLCDAFSRDTKADGLARRPSACRRSRIFERRFFPCARFTLKNI